MVYLSGLVGLLLVLTAEAKFGNSSSETRISKLYELICQTDDYEVRHYDAVKWASTNVSASSMEMANAEGMKKISEYFDGHNENATAIDMTAPFVIEMPTNSSFGMKNYKMSFLLPENVQMNPPNPLDDMVTIEETPEMTVFVQNFTGLLRSMFDSNTTSRLSGSLDLRGLKYSKLFGAAYNNPLETPFGDNEVWFVVEEEEVQFASTASTSSSEEMTSETPTELSLCF